jgi:hypothetical protein
MGSFKEILRTILPAAALNAMRGMQDAVSRLPDDFEAAFHPWRCDTIRRIQKFKNAYAGKRCFIIGNGPSLNNTDLSKLQGEFTFGMNRIFLMFPELGFQTTFLVSVNDLVIEQSADDIRQLEIPKFISWRSRRHLEPAEDIFYLYSTYTGKKFSRNAAKRLWEGATVTYISMQLAYYMGFSTVILIGVDHSFTTKGKPNETIVSEGDDPNHFNPAYFGIGFRWQLPDLDTSEVAYHMAKQAFEGSGREVLDATVGGHLTVFPKVDYLSLFK